MLFRLIFLTLSILIGKKKLLWAIFIVLAITTFITEQEIIWLILLGGMPVWFAKAPPKWLSPAANGMFPVGVWCYDREPDKLIAKELKRDFDHK